MESSCRPRGREGRPPSGGRSCRGVSWFPHCVSMCRGCLGPSRRQCVCLLGFYFPVLQSVTHRSLTSEGAGLLGQVTLKRAVPNNWTSLLLLRLIFNRKGTFSLTKSGFGELISLIFLLFIVFLNRQFSVIACQMSPPV